MPPKFPEKIYIGTYQKYVICLVLNIMFLSVPAVFCIYLHNVHIVYMCYKIQMYKYFFCFPHLMKM